MHPRNQSGKHYGSLTVVKQLPSIQDSPGHTTTVWLCRCVCGKEVAVRRGNLTKAKSCGCQRKRHVIEIKTGDRFGKLVALTLHDHRFSGHRAWECKCDCGVTALVPASELRRGQQSCGCDKPTRLRNAARKEPGHAGMTKLYAGYRSGALDRGIAFDITKDDFFAVTKQSCFYCDALPSTVSAHGKTPEARQHSAYRYNGLDRVDNDAGYHKDNVVACCSVCNYARGRLSQDSFLQWIARAYLHSFGDKP